MSRPKVATLSTNFERLVQNDRDCACMWEHCHIVVDHTEVASTPAKRHDVSPVPAGQVIRQTAGQNTAPKFGESVCFFNLLLLCMKQPIHNKSW